MCCFRVSRYMVLAHVNLVSSSAMAAMVPRWWNARSIFGTNVFPKVSVALEMSGHVRTRAVSFSFLLCLRLAGVWVYVLPYQKLASMACAHSFAFFEAFVVVPSCQSIPRRSGPKDIPEQHPLIPDQTSTAGQSHAQRPGRLQLSGTAHLPPSRGQRSLKSAPRAAWGVCGHSPVIKWCLYVSINHPLGPGLSVLLASFT